MKVVLKFLIPLLLLLFVANSASATLLKGNSRHVLPNEADSGAVLFKGPLSSDSQLPYELDEDEIWLAYSAKDEQNLYLPRSFTWM